MKLIFFWGANAIEASATISECLDGKFHLEPAGDFLLLLLFQMAGSWIYATLFKKELHSVNFYSEVFVLLVTAAKFLLF